MQEENFLLFISIKNTDSGNIYRFEFWFEDYFKYYMKQKSENFKTTASINGIMKTKNRVRLENIIFVIQKLFQFIKISEKTNIQYLT